MNSHADHDTKGPGIKFPPPLIALGVILLASGLHTLIPLSLTQSHRFMMIGYALAVISILAILAASVQFFREKTQIEPWKPTSTIIQNGIFAYSRNPVYLAFCIATIGVGLIVNSWWVVASVLPLVTLLDRFVIRHEEAYLQQKFGDEYLAYRNRVRRWL